MNALPEGSNTFVGRRAEVVLVNCQERYIGRGDRSFEMARSMRILSPCMDQYWVDDIHWSSELGRECHF